MKHKMFSVHDRKAGAFLPPFMMHTEPMAERVFADCCNADDHQFGKHPEDYTLFRVGEFDDVTGVVKPEASPVSVGNGITYLYVDRGDIDVQEEAVHA